MFSQTGTSQHFILASIVAEEDKDEKPESPHPSHRKLGPAVQEPPMKVGIADFRGWVVMVVLVQHPFLLKGQNARATPQRVGA